MKFFIFPAWPYWPFLTAMMLGFTVPAQGQHPKLQIGPNFPVGKELDGKLLIEPHIAADPGDPNKLIAVSFVEDTTAEWRSGDVLAVFSSSDGGQNWNRQNLPCIGCSDPWVSITNKGLVFATAMGNHPALPDLISQLLVFVSKDGGLTWSDPPQSLGDYHDGPRSLAGPDGTLYILSGQNFRDEKKNLRFSGFMGRADPGQVYVRTLPNIAPNNLCNNSDGLALLSDGALVITFYDFLRKFNGGFGSRAGALKTPRSWAMITEDRGRSFTMPLFVTEDCWNRPAFLAVDASGGPFKDRLYYVCEGDNLRKIVLTYSADRGEEWTTVAIEPPAEKERSRSEPQIAVNKDGVVGVAWMDRRDDPLGKCYAPYFAASFDGGQTFSTPVKVADALSCPDLGRLGAPGHRFPTGGDYFGLTTTLDGRFHLLWPDARRGNFELWTAQISVAD